jgi:hypothetical protein
MSKTRKAFLAWAVVCVPVLCAGRASAQIRVKQSSWVPDSLVTFKDLSLVCSRMVRLPLLVQEATEQLTESRQANATAELDGRKKDSVNARDQLARWNARLATMRSDLRTFCALSGATAAWTFNGIPSRHDIKIAADTLTVLYNPRSELLGAPNLAAFADLEPALINGLAKFLVDRAATELQLAFIDRVRDYACATPQKLVFDATCLVLQQPHLALRSSVMRELRSAAEEDLRHLPHTAPLAVISTPAFQGALTGSGHPVTIAQRQDSNQKGGSTSQQGQQRALWTDKRQQDYILTAYVFGTVLERLVNGAEPLEALNAVLSSDPGVIAAASSKGILIDALATSDTVITLPVTAGLFRLALIARMLPDVDANGKPELPTEAADKVLLVKTVAVNLLPWLSELGVATKGQDQAVIATAADLSKRLADTRDLAEAISKQIAALKGGAADPGTVAQYARLVDDGLAIAQTWAAAFERFRPQDSVVTRAVKDLRELASSIARRDYAVASFTAYSLVDRTTALGLPLAPGTAKFLSFVTATAQVETSDDFAKVLDSYAAPVRSYRAKRNASGTYWTINGYLGGAGGYERANKSTSGFAGVGAPIGLELGRSVKGWSIGGFAQILDVGTPASYRITKSSDSVDAEPKAGFAQVFSPGGYLMLGFPKVPLTFGVGGNVAPQLRKLSTDSGVQRNAFRFGAILGVDIPIFIVR